MRHRRDLFLNKELSKLSLMLPWDLAELKNRSTFGNESLSSLPLPCDGSSPLPYFETEKPTTYGGAFKRVHIKVVHESKT